ncbi:MAG: UDP-N-acetylglucosamine 2-epimerase (non-hydrolyzing) [Chitinophagales bacterium]|nr:UDP-N-acetylglucosamine 2-epimerase (non-hydrolyzing) [Chitinophagales bacterium]
MKRLLFIFGTRPEAIKMAPLIKEFQKDPSHFEVKICITAQHREMLDQVLDFFDIEPDFDLNLMKKNQTLYSLTSAIIQELPKVFDAVQPHYTFVHGDTTTSMVAGLASFYYKKTKLCHIEAGLRTYNKYSPYPEEINRQITSLLTDLHYAPTKASTQNLVKEGISNDRIVITGNTVIDALFLTLETIKSDDGKNLDIKEVVELTANINNYILVTAHRRENFGEGIRSICEAINTLTKSFPDIRFIIPVHLNPNIKNVVYQLLGNNKNILLIPPQDYISFVYLMSKAYIILTDSGGVQEEAPSLGKPVILLRDTTERPEALESGTVIKASANKDKIIQLVSELIEDSDYYQSLSQIKNPYGDGTASKRIVQHIKSLNQ